MNIIGYVETQLKKFDEVPFNQVDSLALSQFAYAIFKEVLPQGDLLNTKITLKDLLKAEYLPNMINITCDAKKNLKLLLALGMSPRFRDIKLVHCVDILDAEKEMQFAAITFILDNQLVYVSFRGTDASLVGWKEDFNMFVKVPVPAQEASVKYLNEIGEKLDNHQLIVGGHSKGGNLAVYASMFCTEKIRERIICIYSHDGPGFRDEPYIIERYNLIKERIHKTMPYFAFIGMFSGQDDKFLVVESSKRGLLQHDAYSWNIEDGDFKYLPSIAKEAKHINDSIMSWLSEMNDEQRELFISTMYDIIEASGKETLADLTANHYENLISFQSNLKDVDPQVRSFVRQAIRTFFISFWKF